MSHYDLVITGAKVVRPGADAPEELTVAVTDGKFAAIGPDIDPAEADRVVDAGGKHLFPGAVDVHQHCMGKPRAGGFFQPSNDRRAFPCIVGQETQRHLRIFVSQTFQLQSGTLFAAVIDDQARQTARLQARQHARHHRAVVVAGD